MISTTDMIIRLLVAAVLGSLVGVERERLQWAAGLRTHMLVSLGACLFMLVSAFGFSDALRASNTVLDPSRIAAQVASGIGFLGAGTILFRGELVKGLTTAASLWAVAAVGLTVGGGLYAPAIAATLIILVILAGVKPFEESFRNKVLARDVRLRCDRGALTFQALTTVLDPTIAPHIHRFIVEQRDGDPLDEVTISLRRVSPKRLEELLDKLRAAAGVRDVAS